MDLSDATSNSDLLHKGSSLDGRLILKFFLGERVHPNGRTIHEILNIGGPKMVGSTGGVVQWLFPLTIPSRHVPSAPTLSPYEVAAFRSEPKLRELYLIGVNRFLQRWAIAVHGTSASIEADFCRQKKWMYATSHSFMPITRILRSLKLLGFPEEFATLRKTLLLCNKRMGGKPVDRVTFDIWMHI